MSSTSMNLVTSYSGWKIDVRHRQASSRLVHTMLILGITAYRWRSFIGVWNDARRGSHPTAGYWADGCLSTRFRLFPSFSGSR